MEVSCRRVWEDLRPGDSVAVNGVCLTVVRAGSGRFVVQAMPETLRRTNLEHLAPGDGVNLERSLSLGGRLGGHLVTGHVDATGTVASLRPDGDAVIMDIATPPELLPYLAPRGSVAVDGVSLTIAGTRRDPGGEQGRFWVSLIPHTRAVTNLGRRKPGDVVNLEVDILARYVKHLLQLAGEGAGRGSGEEGGISVERLREVGFL